MNNKLFKTLIATAIFSGAFATIFSGKALSEDAGRTGITVTLEAPTIQDTQLANSDEYYVVNFEDQNGTDAFNKTVNDTTYSYSNDLEIKAANQWGGANSSKFITQQNLQSVRSYSLNVSQDQKYFGFWWSAGDAYNKITFKNDGEEVASFVTSDLVDFIDNSGTVNAADYKGNPAYSGESTGHLNEPFAYVNVFFGSESAYDEIVVASLTEGGAAFESDNHTFSAISQPIRGEIVQNNAPVANDDEATTSIFSTITVDVLANDTDPDNDQLSLAGFNDNFSGGKAKIENNKIVYTAGPVPGGFSLSYTVKDEYGKTSTGTLNLNVVASPD